MATKVQNSHKDCIENVGAIQIEHLTHMQSDLCFYCKFGSSGHGRKSELSTYALILLD